MNDSTIIEIKDVVNISNSNQFRGYFETGKPIQLVVSPNTQRISQPLRELISNSGGSIRVYDPSSGTFKSWISK
ncbi:putative toxin [Pandoraea pulmonicola]|uniref:putative toxin n=1 Tax=Pandoraea pulmonicola TaxID=93221 RepID=UPI003AAB7513